MNRMRKALVAASLLAALPGVAAAQRISTSSGELQFQGLFTTDGPDDIPQTADDALGAPNATVNISGVGYITSGAFFDFSPFTPVFRPNGASLDFANYTFVFEGGRYGPGGAQGVPGVITDPFDPSAVPTDPSVVTTYSTGILNIYRDPVGVTNYSDRSTFGDGTLFLSSEITFLRSSFNPAAGLGSVGGTLRFTGGELFNAFLLPNGILTGTVDAFTNLGVPPGLPYDFRSDGEINANVIPEPSTYMLMGTGLLALAGFARRRRA